MSFKDQIDVAEQLIAKTTIPVLPREILALQKLFNESDMPDPKQVKTLISANPLLAGELTSLANLPSLAGRHHTPIKDLNTAIYRLGNRQLKNYLLSIHVKQTLNNNHIKGLSYHCQNIAEVASEVARRVSGIHQDEAYLLGLMHDIGSFVLSELDTNYGPTFVGKLTHHYSCQQKEYAQYGTTHSALGYVIARSWSIPKSISQTILLHHERQLHRIHNKKLRTMTALLELAHALSIHKHHKNESNREIETMYAECLDILKLDQEKIDDILRNMN